MYRRIIRIVSLCYLTLLYSPILLGQGAPDNDYFLKALRVNSGFGYVWNSDLDEDYYHELTWNSQFSVTITRAVYVGVFANAIYTWGTVADTENYFLKGAFVQYDITKKRKIMTYLEMSYAEGDYCTCGDGDPFRKNGLRYLGYGAGFEYPFAQSGFYASGSLIFRRILGDVPRKYNYNIPKIGISYRFGKRKSF